MSPNRSVRASLQNILIYSNSFMIATCFQLHDLLLVADVVHGLNLCLSFNELADDAALWQPVLFSKDGNLIILDQQDMNVFPTPLGKETNKYQYVYHSTRCIRRDQHHLQDTCIRNARLPKARRDPRYIGVGKVSIDERYQRLPTRASSLKRRSTSSSRTSSLSPTRTEAHTEFQEIPSIISLSDARSVINSFREHVWMQSGGGCAITREGDLNGSPSPGVEAAHLVPQSHWNVFPLSDEQDIADPNSDAELEYAWRGTWTPHANGIMLESTLHRCFNAQLISIHPETHQVRAFINLGLITKYHGQKATLPRSFPKKILQFHSDMCCFENNLAPDVPPPPPLRVLTDISSFPPRAKCVKTYEGDPSKPTPDSGIISLPGAPLGTSSSDKQFVTSYQATAHPPSPPPSEPVSQECMSWPLGKGVIRRSGAARPLIKDTSDREGHSDDRGRSREKKRCIATADNEQWTKRQRLG